MIEVSDRAVNYDELERTVIKSASDSTDNVGSTDWKGLVDQIFALAEFHMFAGTQPRKSASVGKSVSVGHLQRLYDLMFLLQWVQFDLSPLNLAYLNTLICLI